MIDISTQVETVERRVGSRVIEAGLARTVVISQSYRAELAEVWHACTNPERLPRWFLPVTGDLRLHGRYQLEGNAGGTIEECDPPHRFAATWEFGGLVSWIDVRCTAESAERTRLQIEHIALEDEHWTQFGPGAAGIGWDLAMAGLALHLGSGESVDPQAAQTWLASPDGQQFVQRSGAGWRDADIAAGTDTETAGARAEQTIAFYTGAS